MHTTVDGIRSLNLEDGAGHATNAPALRLAICAAGELWGGVEQFILTLAVGLDTIDLRPIVILFHDGLLAQKLRARGITVEVLSGNAKYDPRGVRRLRRVLEWHAVDVLHVHGYKATVVGGLAARSTGISVVKTEHGRLEPLPSWRHIGNHCRLSANILLERLVTRCLVDGLAFVSRDIHRLARIHAPGIPQRIIYNGIDPVADGDAKRADHPNGEFNIGIVGRVAKVKGHQHLFAALAQLRHLGRLRLHVFGTGPLEDDCKRWCEQWGLTPNVSFHGFKAAIHGHIAALDLLVIPSIHEGLPYVLLEAMQLRVPVIASRVGGLQEVLEDGPCGVLVPAADAACLAHAIERLYHGPKLRARLAERAHRRVRRHFLAGDMVRQYDALYRELRAN